MCIYVNNLIQHVCVVLMHTQILDMSHVLTPRSPSSPSPSPFDQDDGDEDDEGEVEVDEHDPFWA
ncbi:hypothetical protein EON63_08420 [archaeon]|nr:MAG: hypothetical protein EON63_08420 [archaeon]